MSKQIYEAQTCRSVDFLGIGRTRCYNLRLYIFLRSRSCRKTAILKAVYKVPFRWFKVSQCPASQMHCEGQVLQSHIITLVPSHRSEPIFYLSHLTSNCLRKPENARL